MTFDAAFKRAAHADPRTTVRTIARVHWRGWPSRTCGFDADPHAVIAPEMTPRRGGSNVNGRVNRM
jgi:hypothetical protein